MNLITKMQRKTNRNGKKMKFDFNIAWKKRLEICGLNSRTYSVNRDDLGGGDGHGPDLLYG